MRKFFIFLVTILVLFLGGVIWWQQVTRPPQASSEVKRFVIIRGSSAIEIGNQLRAQGLIRSSLAFKFLVQLTGNAAAIQAGEYRLATNLSLFQIINTLLNGPGEIWVTVPEGLRREEIAEKFSGGFDLLPEEALIFHNEFLVSSQRKEGYLFPDTYLFPKTASASAVVQAMLNNFNTRVDSQIKQDANTTGLSLTEIVILASLVERETRTNDERPIVAGILLKRVRAGWSLDVDATLQYALANSRCQIGMGCQWWQSVSSQDKTINSAFNTYKFAGLPPAPIGNPGLASIKAIVYSQDSDYWFYLHDSDGQIHYARTLEEHNANVSRYLQ
jgi:UPF0755 protein